MQIIPALYLKNHSFALFQPGNRSYVESLSKDPYELIASLNAFGFPRIHIIDQDSWGDKPSPNTGLLGSLNKVYQQTLEVGGGIRNMASLRKMLNVGLDHFVLGSALFDHFSFLVEIGKDIRLPNRNFLLSIDIHGGKLRVGNPAQSEPDNPKPLIRKCIDLGFSRFVINDLNVFQLDEGPDIAFYRSLVEAFPHATFSAAGRIVSLEHVDALAKVGVAEVMVGNEIYQEEGLLEQIAHFNEVRQVAGMV